MSDCFSQIFRFDCGSSVKLLSSKIEDMFLLSMVQFCSGRAYVLFLEDMSSFLVKSNWSSEDV